MKGFTLIEILVVIAILSILVIGLYGVLSVGDMSATQDMGLLDLQQQARRAMDEMIKELRQSRPSAVQIPSLLYPALPSTQFIIPTSLNPVAYSCSIIYYLTNNRINRAKYVAPACTTLGTPMVLANNVSGLIFSRSGNILQIQLTLSKTVKQRPLSFSLTERVRLRNE